MNYNFEWDPSKAASNLKKHKISFERAASVFKDKNALSIFDEVHSAEEERWITLGLDEVTKMLVVVHTYKAYSEGEVTIRIISARKATKREAANYYES